MRARFAPKGLTESLPMADRGVRAAVDLRSDTVTHPSTEMRRAMMAAEVGDDVYGEDPTVNRLEARSAELLGKEAAIFVPTGTMANQIAVHLHTRPGQEVVCEASSHLFNLEMGMSAAFSGVQLRPVVAENGRLTWGAVEPALRLEDPYNKARTGLVVVENTHNWAGGVATPPVVSRQLCAALRQREVPIHLDGARLFNAALALGIEARELAEPFDSVMFCLSKGLGAPVGSMLLGSRDFIHRARIARKMLGGGMRQAGVLAAAALVALEKGRERLPEDHRLARLLADGLGQIRGVRTTPPDTNIVVWDVSATEFSAPTIAAKLAERNVLASALDPARLRMVTHCDIEQAACEEALFAARAVIERE